MDDKKMGKFLKNLRIKNNLTQDDVSDKIYLTRQQISNIELGKTALSLGYLKSFSDLYGVNMIDIISCSENSESSNEEVNNAFISFVSKINKKWKIMFGISICISLLLIILFGMYYFLNTYNSIYVYQMNSSDDSYIIDDGIMVITNDVLYLNINLKENVNADYDNLELVSIKNGIEQSIVRMDDKDLKLYDYNGYESYFNYNDVRKNNLKLYLKLLNGENIVATINLDLSLLYKNNNLIFNKKSKITGMNKNVGYYYLPEKIEKKFTLDDSNNYILNLMVDGKNTFMSYYPVIKQFIVVEEQNEYIEEWIYDLSSEKLDYEKIDANGKKINSKEYAIKEENEYTSYFINNYFNSYLS